MRFLIFIFAFLISSGLYPQIVEVRTMAEAKEHFEGADLVLFDIDNTIMEPVQVLGSDQWFRHQIGFYQKQGLNFQDALDQALFEWISVQCITDVQLVESDVKGLIDELQRNKRHHLMGLTTRGLGLANRTVHQLRDLGISLSRSAYSDKQVVFLNGEACLYRDGVLFTSGTHKGNALKILLDQLQQKPKSIAFINDRKADLDQLEEFCENYGIAFMGIRYGFLDEKVKGFSPEIADVQLTRFKEILSDQEAAGLYP